MRGENYIEITAACFEQGGSGERLDVACSQTDGAAAAGSAGVQAGQAAAVVPPPLQHEKYTEK